MRVRYLLISIVAALVIAAPIHAQGSREPSIAPAGDWVERLAIPEPSPSQRDRPVQALLVSSQILYGADHHDQQAEFAFLIQNSQGLQSLGNITLPWQPDQSELIIHKVQIIRQGTIIDLLAAGQRFTVVRRESNLDAAMLDGVLTAVMQAEGLAVGDILDVSFTLRRRAGALPLRGENFLVLPYGFPVRRLYARQIWPARMAIRWRASGTLERSARTRTTRLGTELILDLADAEGARPPAQAPARFSLQSMLQLSEYRNWAEISAVLAPHYERAAELSAGSPLRERIARIAAASADPRARAIAALRLVQDEIRYFAVTIGDGNYLPAAADETWTRRYGDCKGKTAALLALLRGLGIEAEPILVHSAAGDALEDRLPQMGLFDHVIVRARIDGRSYWLDGTRAGDRQIEELASSRLGWGLPVRAGGAELERLPFAPAILPGMETHLTYDASQGLLASIPVTGETILRREEAAALRLVLAQSGEEAFRETARGYATQFSGSEALEVTHQYDEESGTLTLRYSGTRRMDWTGSSSGRAIAFQFANDTISWDPAFTREEGPLRDAPFQLAVSPYLLFDETVILPGGGTGFTLVGQNIDQDVAGVHISRTLALENGRATARSVFRQMQREISATEATASAGALSRIRGDRALVRGSATGLTQADRAALASREAREPTNAGEFLDRGHARLQSGRLDEADSDFERAAALNPQSSRAISNRAIVQIHRRNYDAAEALLTRAAELDPNDFVIHQGRGLIYAARNRPVQAIVAFTRSLELEPNNQFNLMQRSAAYQQIGEFDDALADLSAILARESGDLAALDAKARIHAWRGETDQAIAAADAILAPDPRNPMRLSRRAWILRRVGRAEAAAADYAQALAIVEARIAEVPAEAATLGELRRAILTDSGQTALAIRDLDAQLGRRAGDAQLLNARCWARATANVELTRALADCEQAVARAPDNASILDSRAFVKLRLGQIDGAIADATAALARNPQLAPSLYVRAVARLRKGEREAGEQDLRAARRIVFDIEARYRAYGVTP
jgi:tetratricopeptide (TPR) repeat protein